MAEAQKMGGLRETISKVVSGEVIPGSELADPKDPGSEGEKPALIVAPPTPPRFGSQFSTTPDTEKKLVNLHFQLFEPGKSAVKGKAGLDPQAAAKLGRKLLDDAAFVRKHTKKTKKGLR